LQATAEKRDGLKANNIVDKVKGKGKVVPVL
jgi:hypothetical protein